MREAFNFLSHHASHQHGSGIVLTTEKRRELEALAARRSAHAGHVRRARVVLLSADGVPGAQIALRIGLSQEQVSRTRRRFVAHRVAGLAELPKAGRKDHAVAAATVEQIVQTALGPPPAARTRWTTRLLGKEFGLTSATTAKVLRANGLKPHLRRPYKVSRDPEFAAKGRDVVGPHDAGCNAANGTTGAGGPIASLVGRNRHAVNKECASLTTV